MAPTQPPPGAHLGLTWRPLTAADVAAAADLAARAHGVDQPLHPFSRSRIEDLLGAGADSLAGFDGAGVLRAAGLIQVEAAHPRVLLWATIDPPWRGRGVGRALLGWQEGRARELLGELTRERATAAHGARIAVLVDEHLADRRRMCVAAGYAPTRTVHNLELPLATDRPEPAAPPPGIEITAWSPVAADDARAVHDAAFEATVAQDPMTWSGLLRRLRPAWTLLARDGADVVGFVLSSHDTDDGAGRVAYTDLLAVRPDRAGAGIGRALLTAALAAYAADDMDVARLDVDARNPARELYAGLGYRHRGSGVLYSIEL